MKKRNEIKEKELKFLAQEYKKFPHLFQRRFFIEDGKFLEKFGIFIPGKKELSCGFLKLWPQDFIVEEIYKGKEVQSIYPEKFSIEKKNSSHLPTIYATLVKCNISTLEAIEEIANSLNLEQKNIQTAGMKDKDAITSQKISFRKISLKKLEKLKSPYFFLKNALYDKGVVEKGALEGNKFTILVRTEENFQKENFFKKIKEIEKQGFYNFYYLQRFGTPRLINFHWGFSILKGDYKKAIFNFLSSPGKQELPYFQEIRKEIKKNWNNWQKIEEILTPFPIIFQNELKLVRYLKKRPGDFLGALKQIPEQIILWIFAFSSWLFNNKLALYIKEKEKLPKTLPLFLSKDKEDWFFYQDFLKKLKIFPPPFQNLKPYPYIQLKKREIKTKEKAKIEKIKIIPEGVILSFSLSKGVYATTFLAHLFNFFSGVPPKNISDLPVDTKATLGEKSLEDVLNCFHEVIHPKTENIFEKFL